MAILFGLMSYILSLVPLESWPPREHDQLEQLIAPSGMSVHSALIIYSLMMILPGVALEVMGLLVRTGRGVIPTMGAVSLLSLLMVWSLLNALGGGQLGSAFPALGILIALIAVLARLAATLPALRQARIMQAQVQSQYWQSQLFQPDEEYDYGPPPNQPENDQK